MPYNNSAIPPTEEITGATTLPLARVKKILAVDEEITAVSANASFAITIATEMFIRYFADQTMNVVKSERRPRKQIQYRDLANAVSRVDNLSFLEDIVPRTTTMREFKSRKARAAAQETAPVLQNGQTTLDGSSKAAANRPPSQSGHPPLTAEALSGPPVSDLVIQQYEPNGSLQRDESGDVEMS